MANFTQADLAKKMEFEREHYLEESDPYPHEGFEGVGYLCGICKKTGSLDWLDYHKHEDREKK